MTKYTNPVSDIHAFIANQEERLHDEESKILGEWINRYCDDEEGNMIHCYSTAREQAVKNGEASLVEYYDEIQKLLGMI